MSDQSVTFVNVFDVEPDRQQELVDLLTSGAEEVIRHRPGFVSLTLLASRDGRRVVNVGRWAGAEDAAATHADPRAADYAARAAAIATSAAPGLYDVVADLG
jgi:quinol monooxygenase YgiN